VVTERELLATLPVENLSLDPWGDRRDINEGGSAAMKGGVHTIVEQGEVISGQKGFELTASGVSVGAPPHCGVGIAVSAEDDLHGAASGVVDKLRDIIVDRSIPGPIPGNEE